MAHPNQVYQERETGNFILTKEYMGGYNVSGSGSWTADYYNGPASNWRAILRLGNTNFIKRINISENELNEQYELLGYNI